MLVTFIEDNKIGVYMDGKKTLMESDYVKRYAGSKEEAKKVKKQYYAMAETQKEFQVSLHCVIPLHDGKRCLYAVTVNDGRQTVSSLFYKDLKTGKEELFHSNTDYEYKSLWETESGEIYASIQVIGRPMAYISKVTPTTDLGRERLTNESAYDENPTVSPKGDLRFNRFKMLWNDKLKKYYYDRSELIDRCTDKKKPYYSSVWIDGAGYYDKIKVLRDKEGAFYHIREESPPNQKKKKEVDDWDNVNGFLKFLGFPKTIATAIAKKKERDKDWEHYIRVKNGLFVENGKKLWLFNRLFDLKKIEKKNEKFDDLGIIPAEWTLVKVANGVSKVLAYGVADYDLVEENGETVLVYTNGKKVFKVKDNEFNVEREELFEAENCVRLSAR